MDSTLEIVVALVFFLSCLIGPVIFGIRFNLLAKKKDKNRFGWTLIGIFLFPVMLFYVLMLGFFLAGMIGEIAGETDDRYFDTLMVYIFLFAFAASIWIMVFIYVKGKNIIRTSVMADEGIDQFGLRKKEGDFEKDDWL